MLEVVKKDGEIVRFDRSKIENALQRASLKEENVKSVVDEIVKEIEERFTDNDLKLNVENIHDIVEKKLMQSNFFEVARNYIVYRAQKRQKDTENRKKLSFLKTLHIKKRNGDSVLFNPKKLKETIKRNSKDLEVDVNLVFQETIKTVCDGMKSDDIDKSLILSTTALIERDPDYSYLSARIFRQKIAREVFGKSVSHKDYEQEYRKSFINGIELGVKENIFDKRLLDFDLKKLSEALVIERDELFKYIGIQTLQERYLARVEKRKIEVFQSFWMRVAMGLCLLEEDKNNRAIEFYEVMSNLLAIPSTPTLLHSGLVCPQLSSCYLSTIGDDLKDIFQSYSDNAQMSKWSGGVGNDWTNVRGMGALVKKTQVESQGVIPFLKIANDTTVSINRSGKRRGATVAYLETWHIDIEDFLELRKNTGDERRRTHDMNTANWIPDLFMKRVQENGNWTLFSPDEVPDLHHIYGKKFEERYVYYEEMAGKGKIKKFKVLEAQKLYRKMLTSVFETGNYFMCFKDPCNIRSPQDHVGVIHNSNLCTEILENNTPTIYGEDEKGFRYVKELGEVAVCNLASLNLVKFVKDKKIDYELLAKIIKISIRMLDNVIDICFYPIPEAKNSNFKHRPIGLGSMGWQDTLFELNIRFEESDDFVDELQEFISYHAISASSDLAAEKGAYSTFKGSKWDRGIFPLDTLNLLEKERGLPLDLDRKSRLDWQSLKTKVKNQGIRNSNILATAPTASISSLTGVLGACIEPVFKNLFAKSNVSGEFLIINDYLVKDLKKLGLWDKDMLDQIKYYNGSIQKIERIPLGIRLKYKESFEIDQKRAIDLTALRGKWIDQSQSHNIFYSGKSGKYLSEIYMYAWGKSLKTTYYLRTVGASGIEKSTLDTKYGLTQKREEYKIEEPKFCRIDDPTCESCQ